MTVNIYDTIALDGNEAVKALDNYIKRLEKGKVEELTEKQVYSLIKIAKVLRKTLSQE
jgi:hypothetical protein